MNQSMKAWKLLIEVITNGALDDTIMTATPTYFPLDTVEPRNNEFQGTNEFNLL